MDYRAAPVRPTARHEPQLLAGVVSRVSGECPWVKLGSGDALAVSPFDPA